MSSTAPPDPAAHIDDRAARLAEIDQRPAAIAASITANFEAIRPAAAMILAARRVRLCGVGASVSAARVGEYLLRSVGIDARASDALDLVAQPANFDAGDLLIAVSHPSGRAYTARVLQRALHSGLKTIAVGEHDGALRGADVRIEGAAGSGPGVVGTFLNTAAIFGALAARAEPRSPLSSIVPRLADGARRAMSPVVHEQSRDIAEFLRDGRQVAIVGVGAGFAAAQVAAECLREATRYSVGALHLEDALHGSVSHLRPDDLVIQIAPASPVDDRQADLATISTAAGVKRWRIGGSAEGADWHSPAPGLGDLFDAVLSVLNVELLAATIDDAGPSTTLADALESIPQ